MSYAAASVRRVNDLLIGIDRYVPAPRSAGGQDKATAPQGRHAVRQGETSALCGATVPDVIADPWPPAVGSRCRECSRLAAQV